MRAGPVVGALAAGTIAAWIGYAWFPHLDPRLGVRRGSPATPRIALTFDDGPDGRWTPLVLDILAKCNVPATFFMIGERAEQAPRVVRRIAEAGHEIANHSWSHPSLWLCSPERTRREVHRAHAVLTRLGGRAPRFFRPPWGMVNAALPAVLRGCGERAVLWSVQPEGLRPASAERQVERVLRRASAGAIVDFHDGEGLPGAPTRLVDALPDIIDRLREAGYGFATVGELLAGSR